jgi:hypothetical protein
MDRRVMELLTLLRNRRADTWNDRVSMPKHEVTALMDFLASIAPDAEPVAPKSVGWLWKQKERTDPDAWNFSFGHPRLPEADFDMHRAFLDAAPIPAKDAVGEATNVHIEFARDIAREPLRNDLEVGFRHSPLSLKEIAERYKDACEQIDQVLTGVLAASSPPKDAQPIETWHDYVMDSIDPDEYTDPRDKDAQAVAKEGGE